MPLVRQSATNLAANCRGMTLGLDLQGGSRITPRRMRLRPERRRYADRQGLDAAKSIVENRINPFGVSESTIVRFWGRTACCRAARRQRLQTARDITRPAVLMFCEGLQPGWQGGGAGTPLGTVPGRPRDPVQAGGPASRTSTRSGQVGDASGRRRHDRCAFRPMGSRRRRCATMSSDPGEGRPPRFADDHDRSVPEIEHEVQFGQLGEPPLVFNMTRTARRFVAFAAAHRAAAG